jgi:hypothetical protein
MKVQKLSKVTKDQFALAHKYYQIMSVLNDLKLAEGEIQLIAYAAIKGNIADPVTRDAYCKLYKTTPATINNIVYRLKKKKIIIKKDKEIFVNPALTQVKFDEPLALVISLTIAKAPTKVKAKKLTPRKAAEKANATSILNVQKHG